MTNSSPKILLVSEDRSTLRQLSRFLELFGYPVVQVTDGQLALAAMEAESPDLAIVDDDFGGDDGLHLVRSLRKKDRPGHFLFTLLMTAEPEADRFVQALEAGVDDFLAKPVVYGELLARLRAGTRVIQSEQRAVAEAHVDTLTALPSRAALLAELARCLERSESKDQPVSCAVIDLDLLKGINQRLGREAGDRLLQAAGRELEKLRGDGQFLARLDEDCFAIVMPNTSDVRAAAWAERARRAISHLPLSDDTTAGPTASFGVAGTGSMALSASELLDLACEALKCAKRSGRNCVVRHGEFQAETNQWQELAAPGKLFEGTVARDVMTPCAMIVHHDSDASEVAELLGRGTLDSAPVVDADGRLVGIVHRDDLRSPSRRSQPRVADVLRTDPPTFVEDDSFKALFDFFVGDARSEAVVVRDRIPIGMVTRASLASLIEVPTPSAEQPASPAHDDVCPVG